MKQTSTTRKEYSLRNLGFRYDKANDLLYAHEEGSNFYSDVVIGEFHLQFDRKGKVIGLEVLNASDLLGEYGISKELLENIRSLTLKVVLNNNSLIVFLAIKGLKEEKQASITMNSPESPIMRIFEH